MLSNFPRVLKQMEKDVKAMNKRLDKAVKNAQRRNLPVNTDEALGLISQIGSCVEQAKEQAASGDPEAFEALNSCREMFEDLNERINVIEAAANLSRQFGRCKSEISRAKRDITRIQRKKLDVSAAEQALQAAQGICTQLPDLVKGGDIEGAINAVQEFEAAMDAVRDALDEAQGRGNFDVKSEFGNVQAPSSIQNFFGGGNGGF